MREIGSWFGLPSVDQGDASVVIVGCPFEDAVSGPPGAAAAPNAIRESSRPLDPTGITTATAAQLLLQVLAWVAADRIHA